MGLCMGLAWVLGKTAWVFLVGDSSMRSWILVETDSSVGLGGRQHGSWWETVWVLLGDSMDLCGRQHGSLWRQHGSLWERAMPLWETVWVLVGDRQHGLALVLGDSSLAGRQGLGGQHLVGDSVGLGERQTVWVLLGAWVFVGDSGDSMGLCAMPLSCLGGRQHGSCWETTWVLVEDSMGLGERQHGPW